MLHTRNKAHGFWGTTAMLHGEEFAHFAWCQVFRVVRR